MGFKPTVEQIAIRHQCRLKERILHVKMLMSILLLKQLDYSQLCINPL